MVASQNGTNGALPPEVADKQSVASPAPPPAQTISAGTPSLTICIKACVDNALDEIALYDRQIRLWGVKAQEK